MMNKEIKKLLKSGERAVVLLFGGVGKERAISARSAYNILSEAEACRENFVPVGIDSYGEWFIYIGDRENIRQDLWRLDEENLISVTPCKGDGRGSLRSGETELSVRGFFPLLHGDFGEDGNIQGALTTLGVPFVGCKTLCGALSTDKAGAKMLAEAVGIPTLPYVLYIEGAGEFCERTKMAGSPTEAFLKAKAQLGFPVFIKPSGLGSSLGAGCASCEAEFYKLLSEAASVGDGRVLIESYLTDKRELECAYYESEEGVLITPPGEAVYSGEFYDFHEKYQSSSVKLYSVAEVGEAVKEKLKSYTKSIAALFALRHIGRVDFFLSGEKIYFNELNPTPGMTATSLYIKMLGECGVGISEFLSRIGRWLDEA